MAEWVNYILLTDRSPRFLNILINNLDEGIEDAFTKCSEATYKGETTSRGTTGSQFTSPKEEQRWGPSQKVKLE